jgi:hypothetical protein
LLERNIIRLHERWTQTLAPEACGSLIHASNVEQLVAWFKLLYVPANRLNLAGHINAWPPGRVTVGLRRPNTMRKMYGTPFSEPQSSGLTDAARTLTKTSLSPAAGFSISSYLRRM